MELWTYCRRGSLYHSAATMLSGDQEILEYMAENLMQYMNPRLLLPQLVKCGLVTGEDAG